MLEMTLAPPYKGFARFMCVNLPHICPAAPESLRAGVIGDLFSRTSSQCRGNNCRILLVIRNSLLIMSLCIFAGPSALHACTCSNAAPGACPGLKTSDIVFLGTVTDAAFVRPAKPAEGSESSTANATDAAAVPDANSPAAIPAMPVIRYHFHIDE